MINHVEKLWGSEDWLVNNEKYCAKILNLNKGFACSLHYHNVKDETFYIMEGVVSLEVNGYKKVLSIGEQIRIKPEVAHRFTSLTQTARVLEVSTTHDDKDTIRLEDSKVVNE